MVEPNKLAARAKSRKSAPMVDDVDEDALNRNIVAAINENKKYRSKNKVSRQKALNVGECLVYPSSAANKIVIHDDINVQRMVAYPTTEHPQYTPGVTQIVYDVYNVMPQMQQDYTRKCPTCLCNTNVNKHGAPHSVRKKI